MKLKSRKRSIPIARRKFTDNYFDMPQELIDKELEEFEHINVDYKDSKKSYKRYGTRQNNTEGDKKNISGRRYSIKNRRKSDKA